MRILLCYKSYSNNPGVSHIGLGVTAMNCAKFLQAKGIVAYVLPAKFETDIEDFLNANDDITHVIVSALWVRTATWYKWCAQYPWVQFATTCHSNVGFLQHEPAAITLIREAIALEEMSTNFHIAGNSQKFCSYIESAYGGQCTYIPNLYFISDMHAECKHSLWSNGTLRIGIFGAMRALKNFNTAAGAAISMARSLKADTEIWVNVGRNDGGDANVVLNAIRNSTRNVPNLTLVEYPWSPWPEFRGVIGSMNLLIQPSYSETFNGVTADGVVGGVPSVVSAAIDWAPDHWKSNVDDAVDVARVGLSLLHDRNAACDGLRALKAHNADSFQAWLSYLKANQ